MDGILDRVSLALFCKHGCESCPGVISYTKKINWDNGKYTRTNFYEKYMYFLNLERNIHIYRKKIKSLLRGLFYEELSGEPYYEDGSYVKDDLREWKKGLEKLEKERSAIIIGRSWKKCRYDPKYKMCHIVQNRMQDDTEELYL